MEIKKTKKKKDKKEEEKRQKNGALYSITLWVL